jgi:hypothetical protein
VGLHQAVQILNGRALLAQLDAAATLADLKPILSALIRKAYPDPERRD